MGLRINDTVPNFTAMTDQGAITFHDWIGDSWAILFSHPKDFTPVCTTEFSAVAQLADEWAARDCKVIGVSVDGVEDHKGWKNDIETVSSTIPERTYPDSRPSSFLDTSRRLPTLPMSHSLEADGCKSCL